MTSLSDEDNIFFLEEVDRYRISVQIDSNGYSNTSNNLEELKNTYDKVIENTMYTDQEVLVVIFDYDKDCNVYYYNSNDELN